jgi:dolichol-phosphate mannosyltransferase
VELIDNWTNWITLCIWVLLVVQVPAFVLLLSRLAKGPQRHPPLEPQPSAIEGLGRVSIIVPTLNEAARISPCLEGLSRQSYEVREILVVDSRSQDGTPDLVKSVSQTDPRFRLLEDDPLPSGWVGRPWALHHGFLASNPSSEWILGVDADTQPDPGLVASLLQVAEAEGSDLVSLSPRFILKSPGELWLQPALLMTLVYRFGPTGGRCDRAERLLVNGQCFLCRRSVLEAVGGYTSAKGSFCDDVTLARSIAERGYRVRFLDGSQVLKVRMYEGAWETWQEWGRSLDLKDAATPGQTLGDLWFLFWVQGLPLPLVLGLLAWGELGTPASYLLGLNGLLLSIRVALCWAIASAYDVSQSRWKWVFWLSPLADPLAVLRIFLSAARTPRQWRGRRY